MLVGKSRLVGEGVDGAHPDLSAPTVRFGGCDGEADAAVHEPAWPAFVESSSPGGVQLPGRGQGAVELLAVLHGLVVGEAVVVGGEEDLTWQTKGRM